MNTVHAQLTGDGKAVQSIFSCPQDSADYPNQAELPDDDPRYLAFIDPQPTLAQLIEQAKTKVRALRAPAFASLAGIQSEALANGDTTTAKAICKLQDMLKALPDTDLSACKSEADIDAAFAAGWLAIVAAAPANVASAFNGVQ